MNDEVLVSYENGCVWLCDNVYKNFFHYSITAVIETVECNSGVSQSSVPGIQYRFVVVIFLVGNCVLY